MIILDKNNIIPYMKEHMLDIDFSGDVNITAIGDGSQSAEEAGDGYVNFIFIVRTKEHSFVVKQSREAARMSGGQMPLTRNHLEFDAALLEIALRLFGIEALISSKYLYVHGSHLKYD